MKNKSFITFLILALVCSLSVAVVTGCSAADKFIVTVVGGMGGGEYERGSKCTVEAELEEGEIFLKWTNTFGDTISDQNPYSFNVDANIALVALTSAAVVPPDDSEEDKPAVEKFKVVLDGGVVSGTDISDGNFEKGSKISITAMETTAKKFKHWIVSGAEEPITQNPYVFELQSDMVIQAVFDELYFIAVSGGTVNQTTNTLVAPESQCTIIANEPEDGYGFIYWYILDEKGKELVVSRNSTYTFTVKESEKYYAKFGEIFTVNAIGGYLNNDETLFNGVFSKGEACKITLDHKQIPEGKGFVGWEIEGAIVSELQEYIIEKITDSVTVKAVYGDMIQTFKTPEMSANQMFRWQNSDCRVLEIDRNSFGSVFTENAERVVFTMYTLPNADKNKPIGSFVIDLNGTYADGSQGYKNTEKYRIATLKGETLWELESNRRGNAWLDSVNGFNQNGRRNLGRIFEKILGDSYNAQTAYYLAAQVQGVRGSIYAPSEISEIGPMAFLEENVNRVLTSPDMSNNAMFRHNENYSLLELDRGLSGTAFTEGVDYVKFYVYTTLDNNSSSESIASFVMDNKVTTGVGKNFRLATLEGKTLLHIEGGPKDTGMGNCWVQTAIQPNNKPYTAGYLFEVLKEIIGDKYDSSQSYYFAAQKIAVKDSGYLDSAISEIGTLAFKEN